MLRLEDMERLIISRTDSIGDVVLTLPLCGWIKKNYPDIHLIFLGKSYTRDVIAQCEHCDDFMDWDELSQLDENEQADRLREKKAQAIIHVFPRKEIAKAAKKAGIAQRIGTSGRLYHWTTVNRRVSFSRKRSPLHEAQLNFELLKAFGIRDIPVLDDIPGFYGLRVPSMSGLPETPEDKFNVVLHPGSRGSAREWGMSRFSALIRLLDKDHFNVFITGTETEGRSFRDVLVKPYSHVKDLSGTMDLKSLMGFIDRADALVAASTGPLHLAAAFGIRAIGIYPPIRPMHPGRWAPLGPDVHVLVADKECNDCRKSGACHCMQEITEEMVFNELTRS